MCKNDFLNGAIVMGVVITALDIIYKMGKTKGYSEGLKYQKERIDIYNNGYADGCKSCNKNLVD